MNRLLTALILGAAIALPARAVTPKTVETDYSWNTYASSFTSVTAKTIDVAGYAGAGVGNPNITGFRFRVLPVGGSATFTIAHATKTFSSSARNAAGFNSSFPSGLYSATLAPVVSTTSAITVPAGTTMADAYDGVFEAQTINPVFTFTSLSAAATYYISVEYGTPREP